MGSLSILVHYLWPFIILLPFAVAFFLINLPSILRHFRSKNAPIVTERASLAKIRFARSTSNAIVGFRLESGEQRVTVFECSDDFLLSLPEIGTWGKVTHRGQFLYSFSWGGTTLTLNPLPE